MKRWVARWHDGSASVPRVLLVCTAALALVLPACGSSVPVPKTGRHHTSEEPVIVPYPPPPARVEVVPSPPPEMKSPVWTDGEWRWTGRRWVWQPGHWELPIANGYYAPPTTVRLADGTLYYYPGDWKAANTKQER
jgi:hypothetical protein